MKKSIVKLVSLMLVFAISVVVLSSCIPNGWYTEDNYFPEGYTCGFTISPGNTHDSYYWVETYEECLAAIELLKSHGSSFKESTIFTYEGDLFDTKYCFSIDRHRADKIDFGENPFDRRAEDVVVTSYAFYDEVTIDELVYSYVSRYQCYSLFGQKKFFDLYKNNPDILSSNLEYSQEVSDNTDVIICSNDDMSRLFVIHSLGAGGKKITIDKSGVDVILDSISIVE